MSGGTETTSNTEQRRDPWAPAGDIIQSQLLPLTQRFLGQTLDYTGPGYIGPTTEQQAALGGMRDYLGGQAQTGVVNPAMAAWQQNLDPSARLTAPGAMNPLNIYASEVGRTLEENIRPNQALAGIQAGQYGGYSSEALQSDLAAQRQGQEAIAKYGSGLFSDLYSQGMGAQQNALAMAPQMMAFGASPYQQQYQLGAIDRTEMEAQQAAENARRQFEQMGPLWQAQQAADVLFPAAQLGGTMIGSTTQETQQSPLQTMMGLGMMGAGMMGGFGAGPAAAAAGPAMMGAGPQMNSMGFQPFQWYPHQGGMRKGY